MLKVSVFYGLAFGWFLRMMLTFDDLRKIAKSSKN